MDIGIFDNNDNLLTYSRSLMPRAARSSMYGTLKEKRDEPLRLTYL